MDSVRLREVLEAYEPCPEAWLWLNEEPHRDAVAAFWQAPTPDWFLWILWKALPLKEFNDVARRLWADHLQYTMEHHPHILDPQDTERLQEAITRFRQGDFPLLPQKQGEEKYGPTPHEKSLILFSMFRWVALGMWFHVYYTFIEYLNSKDEHQLIRALADKARTTFTIGVMNQHLWTLERKLRDDNP